MKKTGIPIGKASVKDGKVIPSYVPANASQKIKWRKNKTKKVVSRARAQHAAKMQRPK